STFTPASAWTSSRGSVICSALSSQTSRKRGPRRTRDVPAAALDRTTAVAAHGGSLQARHFLLARFLRARAAVVRGARLIRDSALRRRMSSARARSAQRRSPALGGPHVLVVPRRDGRRQSQR